MHRQGITRGQNAGEDRQSVVGHVFFVAAGALGVGISDSAIGIVFVIIIMAIAIMFVTGK